MQSFFMRTTKFGQTARIGRLCSAHMFEGTFLHIAAHFLSFVVFTPNSSDS